MKQAVNIQDGILQKLYVQFYYFNTTADDRFTINSIMRNLKTQLQEAAVTYRINTDR